MEKGSNKTKDFKKALLAIRTKIGKKICHRRKEIELDTKILATKVGLSQGSISNIEKGKQSITAERLWQFSVALGCFPTKLLPSIPDEIKEFDKNIEKLENDQDKEFARAIIRSI